MAVTFFAGSNARVRYGAGNTNIAGPYSWRVQKSTGEVENTNFESAQDANFVLHGEWLTDNICNTVCTIQCVIDHGSTKTETIFPIGTTISLDLLYDKTTSEGYNNIACFVREYGPTINLKEKQMTEIILRVNGVMPAS